MTLVAFGASVRGPAHAAENIANQDALGLRGCRRGWFTAVCDGLGSHPLSHVGAQAMARAASVVLCAQSSMPSHASLPAHLHQEWLRELGNIPPESAGTTCLAACVDPRGRVVFAQLGDGLIVVRSAGNTWVPTGTRTGFGNETAAVGNAHQPEQWLTGEVTLSEPGDGIVMMTDGVSDDLQEPLLPQFFAALRRDLTIRSRRSGKRWLERQFNKWPVPMHGDDKTVAAIFKVSR